MVTVRPDGRPHATPLLAVWADGAVVFTTGPEERKARNLEHQAGCLLLTSDRSTGGGLAVAVEGRAEPVTDDTELTLGGRCVRRQVRRGVAVRGRGRRAAAPR